MTGHEVATLARMANQIADFFRAYPEAEAVRGVREHMQAFWTRQMLAQLAAHADEVRLDPLVVRAVQDRK